MHFAGHARHMVASAAAVLAVVALVGATLASRMGAAEANAPEVAVEPPAPLTSTSTTSSSTSTSTSTPTTSTTLKSTPTTTKPPRTTVPATTPPAPAPVVTRPPSTAPPAGTSPAERCAAARAWLAQRGLILPAGWEFRCPGPAVENGVPRWGLACWNCERNNKNWIAVDVGRIGSSEATLRHVVAHETCHAIEYMTLGLSTELTADLCAAYYGAGRP